MDEKFDNHEDRLKKSFLDSVISHSNKLLDQSNQFIEREVTLWTTLDGIRLNLDRYVKVGFAAMVLYYPIVMYLSFHQALNPKPINENALYSSAGNRAAYSQTTNNNLDKRVR